MKRVTIRVPATTANLGPGFDAFGCALSLYTDVTFEETDSGLEITGCDEAYTGPDNLAYTAYCAVLGTLSEEVRGVKIHIDAHIPICRGLGSSAALLVAGAMGANVLRGNKLSTQGLLNITNAMEGHPDNLAPAFLGGLTASMVDGGLPVSVSFPLPRVGISGSHSGFHPVHPPCPFRSAGAGQPPGRHLQHLPRRAGTQGAGAWGREAAAHRHAGQAPPGLPEKAHSGLRKNRGAGAHRGRGLLPFRCRPHSFVHHPQPRAGRKAC